MSAQCITSRAQTRKAKDKEDVKVLNRQKLLLVIIEKMATRKSLSFFVFVVVFLQGGSFVNTSTLICYNGNLPEGARDSGDHVFVAN